MLTKKNKKNLWATLFAFFVVMGLVGVSIYILFSINTKNKEHNNTLSRYTGGNTDVSFLKQDIAKANAMKKSLEGWLLKPDQTLELIQYVEGISKGANLSPEITELNPLKISYGEEAEKREVSALELTITMGGTFEETQKFLRLMENVPYQSFIKETHLQRLSGEELGLWQIRVRLVVYTKPQKDNE